MQWPYHYASLWNVHWLIHAHRKKTEKFLSFSPKYDFLINFASFFTNLSEDFSFWEKDKTIWGFFLVQFISPYAVPVYERNIFLGQRSNAKGSVNAMSRIQFNIYPRITEKNTQRNMIIFTNKVILKLLKCYLTEVQNRYWKLLQNFYLWTYKLYAREVCKSWNESSFGTDLKLWNTHSSQMKNPFCRHKKMTGGNF